MVGAGPAGVSAALWALSLGLDVQMIEREADVGGQLLHVHFQPVNVAGAEAGEGPTLAARLARQLADARIPLRLGVTATKVEPADSGRPSAAIHTASGETLEAATVLIATGVRRRRLGVPGDRELEGKGVSYSATQDRARFAGHDIVVIGGGDAAFENALLLADVDCRVTLVVRGRPRARADFRSCVTASPKIEVLERANVVAIEGDTRVRAVRVEQEGRARSIDTFGVVIKIGVLPNSEWCGDALDRDADGYLRVDGSCATSGERIWAAGDVTRPPLFGVTVAAGQGAVAVAAIRSVVRPGVSSKTG